jgi:uncharacterized protein DUF6174
MLIVPGCSRSVLSAQQTAALDAAEARWNRSATRDYSFEFHPLSFPAFGEDSARIEVRGGLVTTVTRLGRHVPSQTTIDDLFGSIRQASASGRYAKVEANYDPQLGYPTRIVFTPPESVADGKLIIEIRAFEKLAGR